jgi:hypothetical protein
MLKFSRIKFVSERKCTDAYKKYIYIYVLFYLLCVLVVRIKKSPEQQSFIDLYMFKRAREKKMTIIKLK